MPEANLFHPATNQVNSTAGCQNHRSFSGLAVSIVSFNCEGLTRQKETLILEIANENYCVVLCLQQTHRKEQSNSIHVKGFNLVTEIKHNKHGSAILVKNHIVPLSTATTVQDGIKFLSVSLNALTLTSVDKPPPVKLNFPIHFSF